MSHVRTPFRLGAISRLVIGTIALAIGLPYALCPRYEFPAPRAFAGEQLFNPYASVAGPWRKINLHAHSRVWHGLTAGGTTREELLRRYAALGYDGAAASNYEQLDTARGGLAAYEQGYGVRKSHLIAVGARHVDWVDYPLLETIDAKQNRIERLRGDGALVIIAHPELRDGFTMSDMRRLCDYDAVEIASDFGDGERRWDAALSAGRLVWGVAGDDSHDADDDRKTGRAWTMVSTPTVTTSSVSDAIRAGTSYAVVGRHAHGDISLGGVVTRGDTVSVRLLGAPATIRFIGRDSRLLAMMAGDSAQFVLPANEPYVRVVANSGRTKLLLNPIVRTNGARPVALSATRADLHFASAHMSLGRVLGLLAR